MKSFCCIFILLVAGVAFGQRTDQEKAFETLAQANIQSAYSAYNAKQYAKAIKICQEVIDAYSALPADALRREAPNAAAVYYYQACYACRNKENDQAIRLLNSAVELGFKDYRQLKTEEDLAPIRNRPEFKSILARTRAVGDFEYILRTSGSYKSEALPKPHFEFEDASDERLRFIRQKYNLDTVAGDGDDVSKVIRLMRWVHLSVKDDGRNWPSVPMNADDLITYSVKAHQGINCRCISITLNDCYLAMGFKSHFVTCLPKDPNDPDCHVIDSVYVPSLKKWVWMDASFGGYFKDKKGTLLGIGEVRDRIVHDEPLIASPELDFNGQPYPADQYRNYMAKNLYWFSVPLKSETDYETTADGKKLCYVHLLPTGFQPAMKGWPRKEAFVTNLYTNDPTFLWQNP